MLECGPWWDWGEETSVLCNLADDDAGKTRVCGVMSLMFEENFYDNSRQCESSSHYNGPTKFSVPRRMNFAARHDLH